MPDEPPAILSDSLSVMVAYPGGCEEHVFALGSRLAGDTAEVWLRHHSGGDPCEGQIRERLHLPLPDQVLEARRIHLLNPTGAVPFVLRWDVQTAAEIDAAAGVTNVARRPQTSP